MPLELTKISAFQLDTLPHDKVVFFFPVGPLEDHGPHLPLGLDLEEADRMCHLAAQHLEQEMPGWVGVIMPRAPLGIQANTTRLALTVRPHVLRDWLVDSCRSLMRNGFLHFVCFSGHLGPKQLTAIEDAGKIIRNSGRWQQLGCLFRGLSGLGRASLLSASSVLVKSKEVLNSPFWPDPIEHGGKRDTSVALVIAENLVNDRYLTLPQVNRQTSRWVRNWERRRGLRAGYWGDPGKARQEMGEKELLDILDEVFPKMRAVWEGANPNLIFRSWYSILPPNKSFFRAWLLVVLTILVAAGWAFLMAANLDVKS